MGNTVEFQDFSFECKAQINETTIAWLYEAAGELKSQVQIRTRVDSGETKSKWDYNVDESKGIATIGNPLENAIWEEFGTGEWALNKNGRKGYWVYVKGQKYTDKKKNKSYTYEEAKRIVAMMREKGLDAHMTKGKHPSRAFFNSYESNKDKLIKSLESKIKGMK